MGDVKPVLNQLNLVARDFDATLAFWTPAATTTPAMDGVAFAYRHRFADPHPAPFGALHAVYPAVVLLVEAVGLEGMQAHAVRVVAVLRVGVG